MEPDSDKLLFKQDFASFLEPEHGEAPYEEAVQHMLDNKKNRLNINLNHINHYDPTLRSNVLQNPMDYIPAWEEALGDYVGTLSGVEKVQVGKTYRIGLEGNFGGHRLTPQTLMSGSIGSMVCVEGIVTKVSLIRPKVLETVHYCEATKQFKTQNYRDATSLTGLPTGGSYPTTDDQGNPLTTEFGLCNYMDHQTVFIQDMPERTQAGSMPQTVECVLDDDLVDACKPGDRVQMIGIFRALAGRAVGSTSGRFKTVIIVNNVRKLGVDDHSRALSMKEIKHIRKIAKSGDIFDLLARSIAPSLFGHTFIKKAILLQMLGGMEKNLENGTHIRGDINILMVGDPSCGKSQLLRAVMNIAPLCINTTGRGSSGVGLTAAVTMDRDSGERRLEAGAMVLADRGIVCIDEFDKMSDVDRTAIHEVMEQQTVTIAKAGIHTSLNARCSVIAAANPVYGMYDRTRKPHHNIGLPDSLLSRFDLLFIVLDKIDTEIDRAISDHVLAMHLTPHRAHIESEFDNFNIAQDEEEDVEMFEKNMPQIHRNRGGGRRRNRQEEKYLTLGFCKKYIEYSKKQFKPKLKDDACEMIAKQYAELREAEYDQTLPITARCLETIIRLSTAHAKLRHSKTVEEVDVEEAMSVLKFALTNDASPQARQSRAEADEFDVSGDESGGDGENGDAGRGGRKGRKGGKKDAKGRKGRGGRDKHGKQEIDDSDEEDSEGDGDVAIRTRGRGRGRQGRQGRRSSQVLEDSDDNDEKTDVDIDDDDAKMDVLDEMPAAAGSSGSSASRSTRGGGRGSNTSTGSRGSKKSKKRREPMEAQENGMDEMDDVDGEQDDGTPKRRSKRLKTGFSSRNVNVVVTTITTVFRGERLTQLSLSKLKEELDGNGEMISLSELKAIITHLHSQNRLFYLEDSETIHQL